MRHGEARRGDAGRRREPGLRGQRDDDPRAQARIEKTVAFLGTIKPAQIDGTEAKDLVVKVGGKDTPFKGMQFLLARAIPNFYFHVTTAYDILRHNGLDVGKKDFLGNTTAS